MPLSMITDKAAIGLFATQADADIAVSMLYKAGIASDSISVVGGAEPAREAALGSYIPPDFIEVELKHEEERSGASLGGALGLLAGFGIFVVTGIGSLVVLGPLVGLLAGAGAGAGLGGRYGGLTFYSVAADYRKQLVAGNYLVFVEFPTTMQTIVKEILDGSPSDANPGKPLVTHSSP